MAVGVDVDVAAGVESRKYAPMSNGSARSAALGTGGVVKSTSPTTENGHENCIYSMNNIHMSDEDNKHDTNYINKHKYTNHDTRKLHL